MSGRAPVITGRHEGERMPGGTRGAGGSGQTNGGKPMHGVVSLRLVSPGGAVIRPGPRPRAVSVPREGRLPARSAPRDGVEQTLDGRASTSPWGGALRAPRVEPGRLRDEKPADGLAYPGMHVGRGGAFWKLDEGRQLGDHGVSGQAAAALSSEDERHVRDTVCRAVDARVANAADFVRVPIEGALGIRPGSDSAVT